MKDSTMHQITQDEYNEVYEIDKPGSSTRWPYYRICLDLVSQASLSLLPEASVLELGPWKLPLIHGSDTMDKADWLEEVTYRHDATVIPWPIEDSKYSLFIALQVWEHLEDKQVDAFKEVMRISSMAILSFPYKWYSPGQISHHNIDDEKISLWTCGVVPKSVTKTGSRVIYVFKFSG